MKKILLLFVYLSCPIFYNSVAMQKPKTMLEWELESAIEKNNCEKIKKIIENIPKKNLFSCIESDSVSRKIKGKPETIKCLLNNLGKHASYIAVMFCDAQTTKSLLDTGRIDAQFQGENLPPILHFAIERNRSEIIMPFIKAGANKEVQNTKGLTPFSFALASDKQEAAKILILAETKIGVPSKDSNPLNQESSLGFFIKNAKEISKKINPNGQAIRSLVENPGKFSLHIAAALNSAQSIEKLISCGMNIENCDPLHKFTPLHVAALLGNIECIEALVNAGANISAKDKNGQTPVHLAAAFDMSPLKTLSCLVRKGSLIGAKNIYDGTPLHCSADAKRRDKCYKLIIHGAKIEHQDSMGRNALSIALNNGALNIVKLLLFSGAQWEYHLDEKAFLKNYVKNMPRVLYLQRNELKKINSLIRFFTQVEARQFNQTKKEVIRKNNPVNIYARWPKEKKLAFVNLLIKDIFYENNNQAYKNFKNSLGTYIYARFLEKELFIEEEVFLNQNEIDQRNKIAEDYFKVITNQKVVMEELCNEKMTPWGKELKQTPLQLYRSKKDFLAKIQNKIETKLKKHKNLEIK